jgi:glycosyltransferase involved in cell wall biosynthesis
MADLAIVTKRKDSFGNEAFSTKILEFMAVGVPIIAADTTIDKFYFSESNVLFFKAGDKNDLAEKILYIYNNNELKKILINGGYKVIEKMNWNVCKYLYLDIISKLTNKMASL